jgi:hypothetical protein
MTIRGVFRVPVLVMRDKLINDRSKARAHWAGFRRPLLMRLCID